MVENTAREALTVFPAHVSGSQSARMFMAMYLGFSLQEQKREQEALDIYLQAIEEIPYATLLHGLAMSRLVNNVELAREGLSQSTLWLETATQNRYGTPEKKDAILRSICIFLIYKATFLARLHQYGEAQACLDKAMEQWLTISVNTPATAHITDGDLDWDMWPEGFPNLKSLFQESLETLSRIVEVEGNEDLRSKCHNALQSIKRADAPPHQP